MNSRPIFARPSPDALLNPRRDPTFKAIFTQGTRESSIALGDFLSSVIGRQISEVSLQPNEPAVDTPGQPQMTFDVSVVFCDGERADIEMQSRSRDYDYGKRSEIQASRLLNNNSKRGHGWEAPRVYQISVLDFEYAKDDKSVLTWYSMRNPDGRELGGLLNIIYLDLVKARRLIGTPVQSLTGAQRWALYLGCADNPRHRGYIRKIVRSQRGIRMADLIVRRMSDEDAAWFRENSRFTYENDMYEMREGAKKRAFARGLADGRAKGLQEGLKDGARSKALEAACNLYANGISKEIIAKSLGMSDEELESALSGAPQKIIKEKQ